MVIAPYDPEWPRSFEHEARKIAAALAGTALGIEHVGSTAVPELAARPILDIDLIVPDSADESAYVALLEQAGYRLVMREPSRHEHRMFRGEKPTSICTCSRRGRELLEIL